MFYVYATRTARLPVCEFHTEHAANKFAAMMFTNPVVKKV